MSQNETVMTLENDRDIVITRIFNAPPRIVFEAWTNAEFVSQWWVPKGLGGKLVSCEADVRPGGKWRYVMTSSSGDLVPFSGKYVEVTAPSRLVYSLVFEPMAAAGDALVTVTFDALPGAQCRLTSRERFSSAQVRTIVIETGMEKGMRMTMDQLDELVATMK